jgi:acyl carrier protein
MLDENALKQVMASMLSIDAASIDEESSIDNIESWDSIRHMNLVLALEEEFRVSIPDDEAANITSYPLIRVVLNQLLKE